MRSEHRERDEKAVREEKRKAQRALEGRQAVVLHESGEYRGRVTGVSAGGFMLYSPDSDKPTREVGRFFSWDSVQVEATDEPNEVKGGDVPSFEPLGGEVEDEPVRELSLEELESRRTPNVAWGE